MTSYFNCNKGYIYEVGVGYPKHHFLFLRDRMKINKCQKFLFIMYPKGNYAVHIKDLKLALDFELILEKDYWVI